MARSRDPDSAGSQFFIVHGNASFLDRQYTAFGKLIKGDDVLDKIANTPCIKPEGSFDPSPSKPVKRIEVKSIRITTADKVQ
jgi:peptidyl-prolyl cis-trans isomerase B (cyclophilin B)